MRLDTTLYTLFTLFRRNHGSRNYAGKRKIDSWTCENPTWLRARTEIAESGKRGGTSLLGERGEGDLTETRSR